MAVHPGDMLHLRLAIEGTGAKYSIALPLVRFRPWAWLEDNIKIVVPVAAILLLGLLLGILFLFWPAELVAIHESNVISKVGETFAALHVPALFKVLVEASLLPALIRQPRASDAWLGKKRRRLVEALEREPVVASNHLYIPLPVQAHNRARDAVVDRPDPRQLAGWIDGSRQVIVIVGPGGSGKTTLLAAMARWLLAPAGQGILPWPAIPVFLNDGSTDPVALVCEQLHAWLDITVSPNLAEALLRNGRAVVIIDRLSERSDVVAKMALGLAQSPLSRVLLMTTRSDSAAEGLDALRLAPEPLDGSTLLYFLTGLLRERGTPPPFDTLKEQFYLGQELVRIITETGESSILTPLLVRLYVDRAIEVMSSGGTLEDLPRTVPDAYFAYLKHVNPEAGTNTIGSDEMFRAAGILATFSVESDLVPKSFLMSKAREALSAAGISAVRGSDVLVRLIDNGVLLAKSVGPDELLRFSLEPVCEFLAAFSMAKACGTDEMSWRRLSERINAQADRTAGFSTALRLVREAYGDQLGWPED